MSRPEQTVIAQGSSSWDAVMNEIAEILFDRALPLPENYADVSALTTARPVAQNEGCLACISDFSKFYWCDGTTWLEVPYVDTGGKLAATVMPLATDTAVGALETATQAEAEALTVDDKIITPASLNEVLRDTAKGSVYHLIADGNTATSSVTTAKLVAGSTTLDALSNDFDSPSNGRLRYTGSITKVFSLAAFVSASVSVASKTLTWSIAKNGTVIASSGVKRVSDTTNIRSSSMNCLVSLATNDYVELFVGANSSATVTADAWNLQATEA